jgi:predicted ArsR family transcriptional regulator
MTQQNSNQEKILYQIKRLGPQTAKSLAQELGLTTMGIRQHLANLEADELVIPREPEQQKRGRPVKSWALTASGHARFPDAHAQVTTEIIASVRDLLGETALNKIIDQRAAHSRAQYEQAMNQHESLEDKLNSLAELRTNDGYMAEVECTGTGEYLLKEQHCPICVAAKSCHGFCRAELETFQSLFAGLADVRRSEYLLDGARRCTYTITARR